MSIILMHSVNSVYTSVHSAMGPCTGWARTQKKRSFSLLWTPIPFFSWHVKRRPCFPSPNSLYSVSPPCKRICNAQLRAWHPDGTFPHTVLETICPWPVPPFSVFASFMERNIFPINYFFRFFFSLKTHCLHCKMYLFCLFCANAYRHVPTCSIEVHDLFMPPQCPFPDFEIRPSLYLQSWPKCIPCSVVFSLMSGMWVHILCSLWMLAFLTQDNTLEVHSIVACVSQDFVTLSHCVAWTQRISSVHYPAEGHCIGARFWWLKKIK